MATATATVGVDAFNGGGAAGNTSSDADTIVISSPDEIQAADTFDGAAGDDTISVAGTATQTTFDFSVMAAGPQSIEALAITGLTDIVFRASQFGTGLMSTTLALAGDNSWRQRLFINDATAFSAAGFVITNWDFSDLIVINAANGANAAITGSAFNDSLNGGDGNDTLLGEGGNDQIDGNGGDDSLDGGTGSDTLTGGNGADIYLGGDGDDTIIALGSTPDTLIDGGNGIDYAWIDRSSATEAFFFTLFIPSNPKNLGSTVVVNIDQVKLLTGSGNDTLEGDVYGDTFSAGAGDDRVWGQNGDDWLDGGSGNDSLSGGGGSDYLLGGDGDDLLDGGSGNDTLLGGAGNDSLSVSNGTASLVGGEGNDTIQFIGTSGGTADGGDGTDVLNLTVSSPTTFSFASQGVTQGRFIVNNFELLSFSGSNGNDVITGGALDDSLSGSAGNDTLIGGGGNDSLTGGGGTDRLEGREGNDTLVPGVGGDLVFGGDGDDIIDAADGVISTQTLSIDGGTGTDYAVITKPGSTANLVFTLATPATTQNFANTLIVNVERAWIIAGSGNDTLTGGALADRLEGRNGNDSLTGGDGNDTLTGAAGIDRLLGGDGDDYLEATDNASGINDAVIDGGAGNDLALIAKSFSTANLTFSFADHAILQTVDGTQIINVESGSFEGGSGNDSITGGELNDTLLGNGGDDYLAAGGGNDSLRGGTGSNTVLGGSGDDTIIAEYLTGQSDEASLHGGDGADLLSLNWTRDAGIDFSLNDTILGGTAISGFERLIFRGGNGNDTAASGDLADTLDGQAGDDSLSSFGGNDELYGQDGNDTLDGGSGNDYMSSGGGNDSILGGAGNDSLFGEYGNDQLFGGEGDDVLNGGSNDSDTLDGGAGRDTLSGSTAADRLTGGDGNDLVYGLEGNDTIVGGGIGNDTIDGGTGNDVLDYSALGAGVLVTWTGIGSGTVTHAGGTDTFTNIETVIFTPGLTSTIAGSAGDDAFGGSAGSEQIDGGAGNDTLDAGAGNDFMAGGEGNDSLLGNDGDDAFFDGPGDDFMDGGAGNDMVSYSGQAGPVTVIFGATAGAGTVTGGGFTDRFSGMEAVIGTAGADTITGGTSAITVTGGVGNDSITGSGADDVFLLGVTDGTDVLDGGAGTDTLRARTTNVSVNWATTSNVEVFDGAGFANFRIRGTGAADTIDLSGVTLIGVERVDGGAGNDLITGSAGNDRLFGAAGDDTMDGGNGDDTFLLAFGSGTDSVIGGAGSDTVRAEANAVSVNWTRVSGVEAADGAGFLNFRLTGTAGNDVLDFTGITLTGVERIDGGAGNDVITGSAGNDRLSGAAGNDTMDGGDGDDTFLVAFGSGTDSIAGGAGSDTIRAEANSVTVDWTRVSGVEAADGGAFLGFRLTGAAGNDVLDFSGVTLTGVERIDGGAGADSITGSAGADRIMGNTGADLLAGGAGADTFLYALVTQSTAGAMDRISDWQAGDRIDLSAIDANAALAGNQDFAWIGNAAFTRVAGQLRIFDDGANTFVQADVNGDGTADMTIRIDGIQTLTAADFAL